MIGAIARSRVMAWALCLAGIAFCAFVSFFEGEGGFSLSFFVCIFGPWLLLAALCVWWRSSRGLIAAGVLLLMCEIYIYVDVVIAPSGSHGDALAYFAKPFLQVFLLLPIGLVTGWIGDKLAALKPNSS